jgi:DNA primase
MTTLTQQIKDHDLASLVKAEGINLQRQGNKHIGLCPFHDDHNPSMNVFTDNHYKCYACGEYGDPVDLIQKLHGFTFKEALQHLGIKSGPMTADIRQRIAETERKRKEKEEYEQTRKNLMFTLAVEIRKAKKVIANIKTVEDMEAVAELFDKLPYWEHCWDILFEGDQQDVKAVMEALKGLKLINRKPLFKPDFDYRQWLKDFTDGQANKST